ncbi:MAG TPA: methyltransferase domain-containing protein [Pseudomonadales bacterium]
MGALESYPRFFYDVARIGEPMSSAELTWDGGAVMTRVWSIGGATIELVHPFAPELPPVGTAATVSIRANSQLIRFPARIDASREMYGSFALITCSTNPDRRPHAAGAERRANTRFGFSPLFPLFCFARHPADKRVIPLYTIDVSNGGISLGCVAPNAALLPGMRLDCRFDAPSIGHFNATLIVQQVTRIAEAGAPKLRVCAEFLDLSEHAREIIGSGLTRPNSSNPLHDLKRENLLCPGWDRLVEFSSTRDDTGSADIRAQFVGRLGEAVACQFTLSRAAGGTTEMSGWSFNPELDEERLRHRVLDEIAAHAAEFELDGADIADLVGTARTAKPVPTDLARQFARGASKNGSTLPQKTRATSRTRRSARPVQWGAYAQAYDVMSGANPAYQENLARFRTWIASLELPAGATICDVGAGTGNYAVEIAQRFPNADVIHLDSDPVMNRTASRKYRELGADNARIANIRFANTRVADVQLAPASLDLIVCVNALYTFGDTTRVLQQFHTWLKPAGRLFLIDLGRPMDVVDWSRYIVGANVRTIGIGGTIKAFVRGRKALGQNRLIRREQDAGRYWLHTNDEFGAALAAAGFNVLTSERCYRDVCDLAICQKPE